MHQSLHLTCKNCAYPLFTSPEQDQRGMILRCIRCGAKNILGISIIGLVSQEQR